jgi:hypothetical protein
MWMQISSILVILSLGVSALGTSALAQTSLLADVLRAPEDGGPRRWTVIGGDLDLFAKPSLSSVVIGTFLDEAVLTNLKCLNGEALTWCEVRSFRGGLSGFVDAGRLQAAVGPNGIVATGVDTSKRRARKRDFDAESEVLCAQERGQSMGKCRAAVARSGGGDATVVVTFPNGFARQLFFVHGEFVRASATMSGVGTDIDWQLTKGVHFIRVEDQRFELPDAFVSGGE